MKTVICTIRHGQTDYNVNMRYAGTTDILLNDIGISDTIVASQKLNDLNVKYDVVISSSLQRAIQTAKLLTKHSRIVQTPLCNERNYGRMQGRTAEEVRSIKPKIKYMEVGNDTHSLNPPGGESFQELRTRAESFYNFIFTNYWEQNILVVSHGVFLQQFHGVLEGKNWKDSLAIKVPYLNLTLFRLDATKLVEFVTFPLCSRDNHNW